MIKKYIVAHGIPEHSSVIYQAKLIQTDSPYAWFKIISDARAFQDAPASPDA